MKAEQKQLIERLAGCRFGTGNAAGRFVAEMLARTRMTPEVELTPRQDWYLRRLAYTYRRQLRRPNMPKPADFHTPPPDKKTAEALKVREAKGEIIVCRAPVSADRARAAELERLNAWNAGKPKDA
jgi:hypothetical protein